MINLTKKDILIPSKPPQLIIVVGPCRTGTTALANVFAKAGLTVYMQPMKSARRAKEAGEKIIPWQINGEKFVVVKETLGAKTEAEFFNPVEDLLRVDYPKENLILIPMVRNPEKTLASWREMWPDLDLSNFVRSYQDVLDIKNQAQKMDIKTIPYVHEATKNNAPDFVLQKLFNKLGLRKHIVKNITNWKKEPKFGEKGIGSSYLKFYDVPPEKFIKEVKNWGEYKYREEPYLKLSQSDADFLSKNKTVKNVYGEFLRGCEKSLGIKV